MVEKAVFDSSYLELRVFLRSWGRAELPPYLGSTLRGVIGQSLYRTDKQAYDYLFANGKSHNGEKDIVNPYMIIPPPICKTKMIVEQREILDFGIVLFGEAVSKAEALVRALENIKQYGLGVQRYPFTLELIVNCQSNRVVWRNGQYYKQGIYSTNLSCCEIEHVSGVTIQLQTPLRIRRQGSLVTKITFPTLMRNITNRMTALTERYGGWVNLEEAKKIVEQSEKVQVVKEELRIERIERYSNRLHEKMDFSGLMGEIEFAGELTPFTPWLYVAQVLHVGRNTTFGMGKMEMFFM